VQADLEGQLRHARGEGERLQNEVWKLEAELRAARDETASKQEEIEHFRRTLSWRLTVPLRTLPALFRRTAPTRALPAKARVEDPAESLQAAAETSRRIIVGSDGGSSGT
jgi:hypothetical protein